MFTKPGLAVCFGTSVLMLLASPALAETYYIDGNDGDDSHDGLAETLESGTHGPRRTWAWIDLSGGGLMAGDRVLFRRGTTISRDDAGIDFRVSNIRGVLFGAYGDESLPNPILDTRGEIGLYIGYNGPTHDLVFEDLVWMTSLPRPRGEMIVAYSGRGEPGYAEGATFRRIEIDATNQTGFEVSDETMTFASNNVTIEDSYFHGPGRNGLYIAGENIVIQRNVVEGFLWAIKFNADGWKRPTRSVIRQNLILNPVHMGIELAEADHCDIYSNVIIANTTPGDGPFDVFIGVQLEDDETDGEPGTQYMNVFNNTFIINGTRSDGYRYVGMQTRKGEDPVGTGNVFRNNLFYFFASGSRTHFVVQRDTARLPTMDHNLYFSDGVLPWHRDGTDYDTLETWQATAGVPDRNSLVSDPLFVLDPAGADPRSALYELSADSPAINAGAPVETWTDAPYEDFLGHAYIGLPDIGAFEFGVEPACDGRLCTVGQACAGGTFEGLCCSGTCETPDTGPTLDGGPGSDGGGSADSSTDVGAGFDTGPTGDEALGGCVGCVVGGSTRSRSWPGFILFGVIIVAVRKVRKNRPDRNE